MESVFADMVLASLNPKNYLRAITS